MILFRTVFREKKNCRGKYADATARRRNIGARLDHSLGLVRSRTTMGERS